MPRSTAANIGPGCRAVGAQANEGRWIALANKIARMARQAGRKFLEECQNVATLQLTADYHLALRIDDGRLLPDEQMASEHHQHFLKCDGFAKS